MTKRRKATKAETQAMFDMAGKAHAAGFSTIERDWDKHYEAHVRRERSLKIARVCELAANGLMAFAVAMHRAEA